MRLGCLRILTLLLSFQLLEGWLYSQPTAPPVQVLIGSGRLEFKFGDPVVSAISVGNMTDRKVALAQPLDQFESRFRYPHCIFKLRNEKGETVKPAWAGDKPPDPITAQSFFMLKARHEKWPFVDSHALGRHHYILGSIGSKRLCACGQENGENPSKTNDGELIHAV